MALEDNFRANLANACNRLGINQAELARRSGVHFTTINRILMGRASPTLEVCERLARAVGIQADKSFRSPAKAS